MMAILITTQVLLPVPGLSGPTFHPWPQIYSSLYTYIYFYSKPQSSLNPASHRGARKVPELARGDFGNDFEKSSPKYG